MFTLACQSRKVCMLFYEQLLKLVLACAAARARRREERSHRLTGKDLLLPAGTARYALPSKPFAHDITCALYEFPVLAHSMSLQSLQQCYLKYVPAEVCSGKQFCEHGRCLNCDRPGQMSVENSCF